jgi:hypothetical protein
LADSINGASSVMTTVSVTSPITITRSSSNCCCVSITTERSSFLNPPDVASSLYLPGSTRSKTYSPFAFVAVVRVSLVDSLVSESVTVESALPALSCSEPRRPP